LNLGDGSDVTEVRFDSALATIIRQTKDTVVVTTPAGSPGRVNIEVTSTSSSVAQASGVFAFTTGPRSSTDANAYSHVRIRDAIFSDQLYCVWQNCVRNNRRHSRILQRQWVPGIGALRVFPSIVNGEITCTGPRLQALTLPPSWDLAADEPQTRSALIGSRHQVRSSIHSVLRSSQKCSLAPTAWFWQAAWRSPLRLVPLAAPGCWSMLPAPMEWHLVTSAFSSRVRPMVCPG
jgi:hypothetical protein